MRFLSLFLMSFLVMAVPAMAQDKIAIRAGEHEGYSRLVFEWPAAPTYSISKESDRVLLRFAKAGIADVAGIGGGDTNIKKVETISTATEPLQVAVSIPKGSKFRDFIVENKLILDVYDPSEKEEQPAKVEEKPVAAVEEKKIEEVVAAPVPAVSQEKQVADLSAQLPQNPAIVVDRTGPAQVIAPKAPAPVFGEHAITITGTNNVGVAVFERSGWLWLVMDAGGDNIAPVLAGPQKDQFPPLTKMKIPNGSAYRMDLPAGMHAHGDGAGLSWRIVLGNKSDTAKPLAIQRESNDGAAQLVWPLTNMGQAITFTDPVIGDKIVAVPANEASQFSGASRSFVNLTTLDSTVGLAFLPKSDDVTAKVTPGAVSVGKPGGLALSNVRDNRGDALRKAINDDKEAAPGATPAVKEEQNKEAVAAEPEHPPEEDHAAEEEPAPEEKAATTEDIAAAGKEKPAGNNIYNFGRWELGGIPTLDQNQHVMMVELSNKQDDDRTEDIITLAKLDVANNRGPEALGMLRIAQQKVADLENNAEFLALRGAANALAGKYDEAVIDFAREPIKNYDDVKFWRTYTLAGLEDWKQAIDTMPNNLKAVETYPQAIKAPMALTLAEVALRAGKIPVADAMLKLLQPDLEGLPLSYASWWKYLAGESERQKNHPAKAEEYWAPLVKDGKDDLFRAKAGLSLTKLQMDTKKIKPEEAINRLEGLRYAWRGDELETLINYRLGQTYINNKNYLKGLTVLRNADSLSPESEMGGDVKDYMTRTFRDIFTNDRLKSVSPLEAISIYEEFKDLIPVGDEGDRFVEKLAERLVDSDLLGRAASLLDNQVNHRLKGDKKVEIAIRLAAIRLLDGNPDGALRSLDIAQDTLNKIETGAGDAAAEPAKTDAEAKPEEKTDEEKTAEEKPNVKILTKADPEKQRQIYLLQARALSMKKKPDDAMAILDAMPLDPDVNKLKTDIAWTAGKWTQAEDALNDLIVAENISPRRPLTEYQRDIILNRGIALNLAGDRVGLANLRDRYNLQMTPTNKGKMFEVVTRPRRPDMIGSREAIESMISEIDLFKGFLDSYAKIDDPAVDAKEPAAPKEPVPASGAVPKEAAPAAATTPAPAADVTAKATEPAKAP